jgi:hypothetical protein
MAEAKGRPSLGDVDAALRTMPETFRNRDFREAMGMYPWPASQLLSMLQTIGVIEHAGSAHLWRVA